VNADADALPEGWACITIGEIASPSKEKIEPVDCPSARYLSLEHIESETGKILNSGQASDVNSTKAVFNAGDVLYGKLRPYLNKVTIPDFDGICSTDILVFPKSDWLYSVYLRHFLSTRDVVQYANHHSSGVQLPRVSFAKLAELPFPLPPLAEQKRIVAKVETLLARVNAARQRLAKVPALLKRFRQSVLAAACSGRLTEEWRETHAPERGADLIARVRSLISVGGEFPADNWRQRQPSPLSSTELPEIPEEWTWIRLPDTGYMNRGRSRNRPRNAPHLYGGAFPFVQTGDIARSRGRITEHQQTYSEAGLAQSRLWPTGTICITIAANIADSAILTYPSCFPDSVVGIVTDQDLCVAEYLEFFIRTAREDLSQFAPATAQKNINVAILEEVAVPLPPLAEQHEIVRQVEALLARADRIEKRLAAATRRVETLAQAILAQAFRGELVPTEAELARREGRAYESASVLLERIRRERMPGLAH
jgi:type I restriction enzyme, S subunit